MRVLCLNCGENFVFWNDLVMSIFLVVVKCIFLYFIYINFLWDYYEFIVLDKQYLVGLVVQLKEYCIDNVEDLDLKFIQFCCLCMYFIIYFFWFKYC